MKRALSKRNESQTFKRKQIRLILPDMSIVDERGACDYSKKRKQQRKESPSKKNEKLQNDSTLLPTSIVFILFISTLEDNE